MRLCANIRRRLINAFVLFSKRGISQKRNELASLVELDAISTNRFQSSCTTSSVDVKWPTIYGGQLVAQWLAAAAKTVSRDLHAHSMHCYFTKAGRCGAPVNFTINFIRNGRSFCTRSVVASQGDETILTAQVSFHAEEKVVMAHQARMPAVPPPGQLVDVKELVAEWLKRTDATARKKRDHMSYLAVSASPFAIRPCNLDAYLQTKVIDPPRLLFWVKANESVDADDALVVIAYLSDHSTMPVVFLPRDRAGFQEFAMSLDHSLWFHRSKARVDDWMLFEVECPIAEAARGFVLGRVWSRDGDLLASFAQEGLIRSKTL